MSHRIFHFIILLGVLLFVMKPPVFSATPSTASELSEFNLGIERSLYVDIFAFTGYTQFSHPQMSDSVSGSYSGIGFTLGFKLASNWFAGITADYRYMGQMTTVDSNHLNLSSTRFLPLAPTLGIKFDNWLIKLDYQVFGNLDINKPLSDGSSLKINKPEGFRLTLIFAKWFQFIPVGVYYENVRFSEQSISQSGVFKLNENFTTWQLGGVVNVLL